MDLFSRYFEKLYTLSYAFLHCGSRHIFNRVFFFRTVKNRYRLKTFHFANLRSKIDFIVMTYNILCSANKQYTREIMGKIISCECDYLELILKSLLKCDIIIIIIIAFKFNKITRQSHTMEIV